MSLIACYIAIYSLTLPLKVVEDLTPAEIVFGPWGMTLTKRTGALGGAAGACA